jgi:hypothetical protein
LFCRRALCLNPSITALVLTDSSLPGSLLTGTTLTFEGLFQPRHLLIIALAMSLGANLQKGLDSAVA